MKVNVCPRLIEKMNKNGISFAKEQRPGIYMLDCELQLPLGLYATKSYKKDDVIYTMSGNLTNKPSQKSIYIGDDMHLEDKFGQYINHSFEPNVKIERNKLIALKPIDKYDELTFNYNENEINMVYPFEDDGILVCGKKT